VSYEKTVRKVMVNCSKSCTRCSHWYKCHM